MIARHVSTKVVSIYSEVTQYITSDVTKAKSQSKSMHGVTRRGYERFHCELMCTSRETLRYSFIVACVHNQSLETVVATNKDLQHAPDSLVLGYSADRVPLFCA